MLDAGVDLRDVQIARQNLDRHPNYILAPTWPPAPDRTVSPGAWPRETSGIAENSTCS